MNRPRYACGCMWHYSSTNRNGWWHLCDVHVKMINKVPEMINAKGSGLPDIKIPDAKVGAYHPSYNAAPVVARMAVGQTEQLTFNHFAYVHPARAEEFLKWARGKFDEPANYSFEVLGDDRINAIAPDFEEDDDIPIYTPAKGWHWEEDD